MSFYKDKITKVDAKSALIHEVFPDLTNNFVYFHKQVEGSLKVYTNQPPTWDNYPSIYEVYLDIIKNPSAYVGKQITVRVPTSLIYTCDAQIAYIFGGETNPDAIGFDRLHLYNDIKSKGGAWLKKQDGYSSISETIHGTVRWIYKNGKVIGFAISKDRGNARTHMAIGSRGGQDGDILINLHFHNVDPNMTLDSMKKIEGANFSEDGEDRRGLDPKTKFRSGYAAKLPKYVAAVGWLKEQDVDFAGVVRADYLREEKTPPLFTLSSTSHLSFGVDGNKHDDFTKYGEVNINSALKVLKDIYKKNKLGYTIQVTFLNVLSRAFYYLSSSSHELGLEITQKAIIDRAKLQKLLTWYYTKATTNFDGKMVVENNISELRKSGEDKDLSWKAFETFLVTILQAIKTINGLKVNYRSNNPAIKAYIDSISNSALRKEATRIIDQAEDAKSIDDAA